MLLFVRIMAIFMIAMSAVYIINLNIAKRCIAFWKEGKRPYTGAAVSAICGVLLLVAAPQCALPWIPITVGFISLLKAVVIFAVGPAKLMTRMNSLMGMKTLFLRLLLLIALGLGVLLLYSV